jgi:hypothetical protein
MRYAYEDLSPEQFEDLVVCICQKLFGIGVQKFSKGADGGRDAKFVGVAEQHPSRAAPWSGTVIIQAKHTNGVNRHFSESDFFSETSGDCVLVKEVPRIRMLRARGQLDHYMLFANRRLAGNAESDIRAYLSRECGVPGESIALSGVEHIDLLLRAFPDVPGIARIDPIDRPLVVNPFDLAEVVEALARLVPAAQVPVAHPPTERTSYARKNALNGMSDDYATLQRNNYLKDTAQIQAFLADPQNADLLRKYEAAADEFQAKVVTHRKDYQSFDRVMEYLLDMLFGRDPVLRQVGHKRLTRAVIFYMYWICDLGLTDHTPAQQALTP